MLSLLLERSLGSTHFLRRRRVLRSCRLCRAGYLFYTFLIHLAPPLTFLGTSFSKPCHATITGCAVATSCCISDVLSQWKGRKFDPPTASTFFSWSFWNSKPKKNSGTRPCMQNLVDVRRRKGGLRKWRILVYFWFFLSFCILCLASRSHRKTDHDQ